MKNVTEKKPSGKKNRFAKKLAAKKSSVGKVMELTSKAGVVHCKANLTAGDQFVLILLVCRINLCNHIINLTLLEGATIHHPLPHVGGLARYGQHMVAAALKIF